MQVIDVDGTVLLEDRVEDPETRHGYSGSRLFDQPEGDAVCVHATHADSGEPLTIRAAWVVGCDGGRSVVRSALGVAPEWLAAKRQ